MISAITSNGSSTSDKVIQIYYSCSGVVCLDISNWTLRDLGPGCVGATDLFTFPPGSIIAPNSYIAVGTPNFFAASYTAGSALDYTTLASFGATPRGIAVWNGSFIEDLVGINGSSSCNEANSVGTISNGQIAVRSPAGTDTDNNATDFSVISVGAELLKSGGKVCPATYTPTSTCSPTLHGDPDRDPDGDGHAHGDRLTHPDGHALGDPQPDAHADRQRSSSSVTTR